MRTPRKTFEERSNPEGVAQRVTAGVSTSSEQLCHPFGVRLDFAPIPGVARASPAYPRLYMCRPFRAFRSRGGVAKAPNGANNIARGLDAKPRMGRTISRAGGTQSPEWGGTYIAGGGACKACSTPGTSTKVNRTPKGWHNGCSDGVGIIVPPLRGLCVLRTHSGGCARVARSTPGYICVAPSGLCATPPCDIVPPLRGSIQYCADTGGCAGFARSPPAIYVSPFQGFSVARWCSESPEWGGQYRARVERKAPNGADNIGRGWNAKPRMGRHIYSRGWSMRSMRNPRKTFEERSNPEGVAQRVTAGVSTSSEQLCHPFGVRLDFAPIPGVARALRAPPPAINVSPRRGFAGAREGGERRRGRIWYNLRLQ